MMDNCASCGGPEAENRETEENPKMIFCPYCEKKFDYDLRNCPQCKARNPIREFHPGEFMTNVITGFLVIGLLFIIYKLIMDSSAINFLFIYGFPALIAFIIGLAEIVIYFYIGRWVREKFQQ